MEDGEAIRQIILLANGYPTDGRYACIGSAAVAEHVARFPEGQFVATITAGGRERVVGVGITMRTARSPFEPPLPWLEMIGTHGLANHAPEGEWLYGVEIAVHPDFQRRGIASALYRERLGLVDKLGLKGWYAGGMLMGYHRYQEAMSPREYARRVIRGELEDPTVTMQLRRGMKARGIIENYDREPKAGHCAVLIVWQPDQVRPRRRSRVDHSGSGEGVRP